MIIKRFLLFTLLFFGITNTLTSNDIPLELPLKQWNTDISYSQVSHNIGTISRYRKQIKETVFTIPEGNYNKVLYLLIYNHTGFSKVYLNDSLLGSVGSVNSIKESDVTSFNFLTINEANNIKYKHNKLTIINYSNIKATDPAFYISSSNRTSLLKRLHNKLQETLPFTFTFMTLILLIFYLLHSDRKNKLVNFYYTQTMVLFIIYFICSGFKSLGVLSDNIMHVSNPLNLFTWLLFTRYYLFKKDIWSIKKISIIGFILITSIFSIYIIHQYHVIVTDFRVINSLLLVVINILFLRVSIQRYDNEEKIFRVGLCFSMGLHIIDLILVTFYSKSLFSLNQTAGMVAIVTYYISLSTITVNKIYSGEQYNLKLLESIDKIKKEVLKRDEEISELKSSNEEITREKALFFTSLSNNLRTPLNSIIGYSENLYSANNLEEVHNTVTDIIVESDKIFQSINNVMDFSTRTFSKSDLLLKDFRMKEIFNNSIYESSTLTAFSKNINYISLGHCDKVIISGNPIIYKQIMTSVLHFLIELNPKSIDYTVFDTGITENHMNLEVKFTAKDLKQSELSLISSLGNYREIFTKYIKLYNVAFNEDMGDDYYSVHLRFQCGLSHNKIKKSMKELNSNLILEKSLNIMVVEDYKPNLNILKMHLTKMGCDVITATNGEEAVEKFRNNDVDVILMDIKMPIMDGWEATESIRSTAKGLETYIIGLTASSLDLDIRHCFESGMDDVQVKPIRKKQLYNKLNTLEKLKPVRFPTIGSLRAELCVSKIETETLYTTSINQIEKQLEVIEVLKAAEDDSGMEKEMPAILHASLNINAFYYSRLLRNFFYSYKHRERQRANDLLKELKSIISEAKKTYANIFRD